jgi:hypothetical protein
MAGGGDLHFCRDDSDLENIHADILYLINQKSDFQTLAIVTTLDIYLISHD